MLCALSGEVPQVPVVSVKSGNVFEKRLIEAYLSENGTDPVTNEELSTSDLIDLKSARIVRPRPPTLTSIPSLLSVFQSEWDALALESYTLKQQLIQTRQELSTALYQHDAAVRVVARLSQERDEARDALAKITISGAMTRNGDFMQVDGQALPAPLLERVEVTREKLSKTRRKRAVPEDWANSEDLERFKPRALLESAFPGSASMALDSSGDLVLLGGMDGAAGMYSIAKREVVQTLKSVMGSVTSSAWAGARAILATSTGAVKVFESGLETASFASHAGAAQDLAVHPSGDILASVGTDKSFVIYDLESSKVVTRVLTNTALNVAAFHPDGHLLAVGGADSQIKVHDMRSGENAANFDLAGPVQCISFSENGTWLAAAAKGETSVSIWDLRKSLQIKTLETGGEIMSVGWDYTGQFLAAVGPSGTMVQQYSKASKEWSEPLRSSEAAVDVLWGPSAQRLVMLGLDGSLFEFS